jgi:hypothetical protein
MEESTYSRPVTVQSMGSISDGAYKKSLGIRGQICCVLWKKYGVYPGGYQETSLIPDEPDAPGADNALQGLAVYDWRRVRRVCRAYW